VLLNLLQQGKAVRRKYGLPERFFLYAGAIYPPKNFSRLVRAYAQVGPSRGIYLVIAGGDNRFRSEHELKVPEQLGLGECVRSRHSACWRESRASRGGAERLRATAARGPAQSATARAVIASDSPDTKVDQGPEPA
jgi:glycosyltransferase involved in cell wall biosynthesis